AASTGVICSSIVLPYYTIGVLVVPVTEEFGWTRAQFQAAILFSTGMGAATAPLVGWLTDRYGPRAVALPGLIGLSLGFAAASQIEGQLWMLFLAYGSMALLGAGTIPVTWSRAIATSFFSQRGLALGIALAGTGICAILVPHYTVWFVENYGWRGAYLAIALLPLLLAFPIVFIGFRPRSLAIDNTAEEVMSESSGMTLGEALRHYKFWILLASIFMVYLGVSGIVPNLFPSLIDNGFSQTQAATIQSVFGISIILGRITVGYLVDRFWAPGIAAVSLFLPVIGCMILAGTPTFYSAALAILLIGLAAGAELDLMAFLTAKYFGLKHYAKIYSLLYATLAVCSGAAPMLFAWVYDQTASYELGYYAAAGLLFIGALLMPAMGRYPESKA
ncbi:MAG: MFS transporter, partial [Pseudomonadota bacterium]